MNKVLLSYDLYKFKRYLNLIYTVSIAKTIKIIKNNLVFSCLIAMKKKKI